MLYVQRYFSQGCGFETISTYKKSRYDQSILLYYKKYFIVCTNFSKYYMHYEKKITKRPLISLGHVQSLPGPSVRVYDFGATLAPAALISPLSRNKPLTFLRKFNYYKTTSLTFTLLPLKRSFEQIFYHFCLHATPRSRAKSSVSRSREISFLSLPVRHM